MDKKYQLTYHACYGLVTRQTNSKSMAITLAKIAHRNSGTIVLAIYGTKYDVSQRGTMSVEDRIREVFADHEKCFDKQAI